MAIAVAVAGKIGSGKTTITKCLAKVLGWPCASFGDYVRSVARDCGQSQGREHLQNLGTQLLRSDPHDFCRAVLSTAAWTPGDSVIIDGLRHTETIEILREIVSPAVLKIVLISVSEEIRLRRLKERGEGDETAVAIAEAHSSEQEVASGLSAFADLVIDGDKQRDAVVTELTSWIRNQ
jgi:dephospho-CoA kinase